MGVHDISACTGIVSAGQRVTDGIPCEGKTDDGDRGADDDGGHQLIDPADSGSLDDQSDHDIDKAREHCADEQTGIADLNGGRAAESCEHGAEEREGRAEEHRAFELGEAEVDERADACAEQGCRLAHAVADDGGNSDGRGENGEQLLQREYDQLAEFRLVLGLIDEFHKSSEDLDSESEPGHEKSPAQGPDTA